MTRVLITGVTDNPGGVEVVVLNYVRRLRARISFDLWVSNERCAFEDDFLRLGCRVFHGRRYSSSPAGARLDMAAFFREHGREYDVLWSNKSMFVNADDLRLARKTGVSRRILHAHNSTDMFTGPLGAVKALLHRLNRMRSENLATDFWACSGGAAEYFFSPTVRALSSFELIHNAIDPIAFTFDPSQRAVLRADLDIPENTRVVGFVGRLQYQKNPEFAIEAFYYLHARDSATVLLILGEGELRGKCEELVCKLGLDTVTLFLGVRTDTNEWYSVFDLLLMPSRFEGLSLVAIEAQAACLPVAISDAVPRETAITDLVRFIPIKSDATEWGRAMSVSLGSARRREPMARVIADGGYDISAEASRIGNLLEGMV